LIVHKGKLMGEMPPAYAIFMQKFFVYGDVKACKGTFPK
jgi:hypothetical protein